MGTRSIIYIYDQQKKIIVRLYLQFDGYPDGVGADLAKFLSEHRDEYMGTLAAKMVPYFFEQQPDHAHLIAPEDPHYHCEEWEYHVYADNTIRVVECGVREHNLIWKCDEGLDNFQKFCENYGEEEDEE
jgi:hypothetical protein